MSLLDSALVPEAASALLGALTFPSVLASAQLLVFKPLQITHTSSHLSSLFGGLAVLAAGSTASLATARAFSLMRQANSISPAVSNKDVLMSALSSVVVFRALGGRFGGVLPSNLLRPGAFAVKWIPASTNPATAAEKALIQQIGKKRGCHSCGTRKAEKFISDHQPPNKLFKSSENMPNQRFYPHCERCSSIQGGVLSKGDYKNPRSIMTNFTSIRAHHLFLPLPLVFAIARGEATQAETGSGRGQDTPTSKDAETNTNVEEAIVEPTSNKTAIQLIREADFAELVNSFPLFILWRKVVEFLDSFKNVGDSFHITLWTFIIVAAMGTI